MSAARPFRAWHEQRLRGLLDRLPRAKAGTKAANTERWEAERLLMGAILERGLPEVDRIVAAANERGGRFASVDATPTRRHWRTALEGGGTLDIAVSDMGDLRTASVMLHDPPPVLTPRERRRHEVQERFYARYMSAGSRAYADPPRRIGPDDRLVLLVGELEADVNNGGFDQYLDNKGRRRARAALEALKKIRATRTARLLETALRPKASPEDLSALDAKFYDHPEDLATLAMRALEPRAAR